MKIITWNCAGAFRKKYHVLDGFDADILVIQECENPALSTQEYLHWAGDYLWIGQTRHKGLGIFAKKSHRLQPLDWSGSFSIPFLASQLSAKTWHTEDLQSFLPVMVDEDLTLLGVWTKQAGSDTFGYIGQLWKYLMIHLQDLPFRRGVIAGDLNSNVIWDRSDRWWNHSDVLALLRQKGYSSVYHSCFAELAGQESQPTYYMHRNKEKGYHIDYCFLTDDLLSTASYVDGSAIDWLALSDHIPQIIRID
ncbi:hypothetical protein [Gilvimarinus chinensis]|uniref:hypothetical protein n=1 Tax=Gilvimarinus chinensis TaxID=396005 RepID=UPI00035ED0C4|nr:hypothetical protein [Gilvimarinus chinensis]